MTQMIFFYKHSFGAMVIMVLSYDFLILLYVQIQCV